MLNRSFLKAFFLHIAYFLGFFIILGLGCQKPPAEQITKAAKALVDASAAEAPRYARPIYSHAESLLVDSRLEVAHQTGRFILFRNYERAESLTQLAYEISLQAASEAQKNKEALRNRANDELTNIKTELASWRETFDGSLINYKAEQYWSSADIAVNACQHLIRQEEYDRALKEADNARAKLRDLSKLIEDYSNGQAEVLKTWRKWVRQTIDNSRGHGSPAIIVVKSTHTLYLVKNGNVVRTFDCELGFNSAQQKYFSGDGATPEGIYQVTRVNKNGSKFYKALMLNYPNDNDRKRFSDNKAKGIISRYAKIGALIEIHGNGGQNKDWTNGCVALANNDIDSLIAHVGIGTPVTIVRVSDQWP